MRNMVLAALLTGPALLIAGPALAQEPAPLAFHYASGQTFRYHIVGGSTSSFGHTHQGSTDVTVTITSHDAKGWHATQVLKHGDGQTKSKSITISDDGVWTDDSSSDVLANMVSFDSRTLCIAGALKLHASWNCSVPGNWVRGAGQERVTVSEASGDRVTFDVTGSTAMLRESQMDPQSNQTVNIRSKMLWHDVITFDHGRRVKTVTSEVHQVNFPQANTSGQTTMHSTITNE